MVMTYIAPPPPAEPDWKPSPPFFDKVSFLLIGSVVTFSLFMLWLKVWLNG